MAARKSTTTAKAATPTAPAVDMDAVIAAATQAALAAVAAIGGNTEEPEQEAKPTGVQARKAATKSNDEAASLRQKRTLLDYRVDTYQRRSPKLTAALKAYEAALNAALLAAGVTGPATLSKGDAFDMIAELKAERAS